MIKTLLTVSPFKYLLPLAGYELKEPSPILEAMLRCTHDSWLKTIQENGRVDDYAYELWSK